MREGRGLSLSVIARTLGCSRSAVAWQCLRLGIIPPQPTCRPLGVDMPPSVRRINGQIVRAFTAEEDAAIRRMDLEGMTPTQIGRALGRGNTSIIARLATLARREEAGL